MITVTKTTTVRVRAGMRDPESGLPIQLASATLSVTDPDGIITSSAMTFGSSSQTAVGSFEAGKKGTWTVRVQMTSVAGEKGAYKEQVTVQE